MKLRVGKIKEAATSVGGGLMVLAITLLPAWALVRSFNIVKAGPADHRKVMKLQPLSARPQDSQPINPFNEPLITVEFDDGWESAYNNALPVLQQDNIPTTQFIITGEFSNTDYMSYDQVKSLAAAGHQIGSHTVSHPDMRQLSDQQIINELSQSKDTLNKIQPNVNDFAIPYGEINPTVSAYIKKYYRSDRLSDGSQTYSPANDINTKSKFDIYGIHAIAITDSTSMSTLQSYIDYTKAHNGWLVLVYHEVNAPAGSGEYSVTSATFKKQMDLLNNSGIRIATEGKVLDALTNGGKR